jgi:V/A-type H+-transporting ATPase subunit K
MIVVVALLAALMPLAPALLFALKKRRKAPVQATRRLVFSLGGFNLVLALMMVGFGLIWFFAPDVVRAAGLIQTSIASALAVAGGSIGAGVAVSATGSAAVGVIAEKPESFGRALIFVGLAEGVAIYGLIIAFMIINR